MADEAPELTRAQYERIERKFDDKADRPQPTEVELVDNYMDRAGVPRFRFMADGVFYDVPNVAEEAE